MRRSARLMILVLVVLAIPTLRADTRPRSTRRTFVQPRVDPRRLPDRPERLTEFQPGRSFVPQPIGAPLPRRNTFYRVSGRAAEIDLTGDDGSAGGAGSLRFYNNRVLFERRTGFRPRR